MSLSKIFRSVKEKYFYAPMARSWRVRRLVLLNEDATPLAGASGLLYVNDDHSLLAHPHDLTITRRVARDGHYQRDVLDSAIGFLKDGNLLNGTTFLDVGANIGTQAIYAMLGATFEAAVCIEPVRSNLVLLRANMALNGFSDRVTIVPVGASDSKGSADIWLDHANFGGHSLERGKGAAKSETIRLDTIDNVLAEVGCSASDIGMVSVDVEGHEPAVVAGMKSILAAKVPLLIEMNPEGSGYEAMIELLGRHYDRVAQASSAELSSPGSLKPKQFSEYEHFGVKHDALFFSAL